MVTIRAVRAPTDYIFFHATRHKSPRKSGPVYLTPDRARASTYGPNMFVGALTKSVNLLFATSGDEIVDAVGGDSSEQVVGEVVDLLRDRGDVDGFWIKRPNDLEEILLLDASLLKWRAAR
jgi:hypothetical protein